MDIDIPGQTLKLEEFDIKTLIKDIDGSYIHPRIVMIAPSGSGKSLFGFNKLIVNPNSAGLSNIGVADIITILKLSGELLIAFLKVV